jgi:3-deoxy-D-manno-octulosonate 8-phosphate phosphatase (KDO 8-P phosphatase)
MTEFMIAPPLRSNARICAMPKSSAAARARKIKLILFDVDGVLTDGKIWIFPAPAGSRPTDMQPAVSLIEAKGFHAHDGTAIMLARMAGIKSGIITKRNSETVAFVGDDIIDLPAMRRCGLAIAVKNARPEVKAEAHWTTAHAGGDGAARDAVEYILKAQGKWKKALEEYMAKTD